MAKFIALVFLFMPFFVVARIVDLEDKEGRRVTADVISLQDGVLAFRRQDTFTFHRFPIGELAEHSLANLHQVMTENMIPNLKVVMQERSRKTDTHWRTSWGSYDKTTNLNRAYTIVVNSTSSFYKNIYVYAYWIRGSNISYQVWETSVGGDREFQVDINAAGAKRVERYRALGERYVTGTDLIEPVIVIKDRNGKVLTSWANMKSLEDVILEMTVGDILPQ